MTTVTREKQVAVLMHIPVVPCSVKIVTFSAIHTFLRMEANVLKIGKQLTEKRMF